jgi:hypothetical protein
MITPFVPFQSPPLAHKTQGNSTLAEYTFNEPIRNVISGPEQDRRRCRKRKIVSWSDRTVPVMPASSKKAMTHHALAKQKEKHDQEDNKQELSDSQPRGLSSFRSRCIKPCCHQNHL